MKNFLENAETFKAQAIIDLCYYMLEECRKDISKPRSNIEMMIDKATGYNPNIHVLKTTADILKQIIKNKKILEAPTTDTEENLKRVKKLLKDLKPNRNKP